MCLYRPDERFYSHTSKGNKHNRSLVLMNSVELDSDSSRWLFKINLENRCKEKRKIFSLGSESTSELVI